MSLLVLLRSASSGVNVASETDTAQTIRPVRLVAVGQASETDTATVATVHTEWRIAVGQVTETDAANAIGAGIARSIVLGGQPEGPGVFLFSAYGVPETDTAQPISRLKTKVVQQAVETDRAQRLGVRLVGAIEVDTAQSIAVAKSLALGRATETDVATAVAGSKSKETGQATETDTALPLSKFVRVGTAVETSLARPLTIHRGYAIPAGMATETDTAAPITPQSGHVVGQAAETETAFTISVFTGAPEPIFVTLRTVGSVEWAWPIVPNRRMVHTSTMEPDIDGFLRAQRILHEQFDTYVTFIVPASGASYPDDTSLDENGVPFDVMQEPVYTIAPQSVQIQAGIVYQQSATTDATQAGTALGQMGNENSFLIITPEDKILVEDATLVNVFERDWRITEWRPEGIRSAIDRWLVFLEETA